MHMLYYLCTNKRAVTLMELAPSPYFANINVHLVDFNVFAKFDENPSFDAFSRSRLLSPVP